MLPRLQIQHRGTETWREATEERSLFSRDEVHDSEEEREASSQVLRKGDMSTYWQLAFGLESHHGRYQAYRDMGMFCIIRHFQRSMEGMAVMT